MEYGRIAIKKKESKGTFLMVLGEGLSVFSYTESPELTPPPTPNPPVNGDPEDDPDDDLEERLNIYDRIDQGDGLKAIKIKFF